jgi:hypothetical protein
LTKILCLVISVFDASTLSLPPFLNQFKLKG